MTLQVTLIHEYAHLVRTSAVRPHIKSPDPAFGVVKLRHIQRIHCRSWAIEEVDELDAEAGFHIEDKIFGGIVMFELPDQHDKTWLVCTRCTRERYVPDILILTLSQLQSVVVVAGLDSAYELNDLHIGAFQDGKDPSFSSP
jgi:hypothetical protein